MTAKLAPRLVGFAGFAYGLIGIVEWQIGTYHGRQLRKMNGLRA